MKLSWLRRVLQSSPGRRATSSQPLTPQDFAAVIEQIASTNQHQQPLETYLRSLWALVLPHEEDVPSYDLFASLIEDAFESEPADFLYDWLKVEEVDWLPDQEGGYLLTANREPRGTTIIARNVPAFEVLKRVLLFQIADLNRIPDRTRPDPSHAFAIISPGGHHWYNVDLRSYWECAAAGFGAKLTAPLHQHRFAPCNWTTLAFLLDLGRCYE